MWDELRKQKYCLVSMLTSVGSMWDELKKVFGSRLDEVGKKMFLGSRF